MTTGTLVVTLRETKNSVEGFEQRKDHSQITYYGIRLGCCWTVAGRGVEAEESSEKVIPVVLMGDKGDLNCGLTAEMGRSGWIPDDFEYTINNLC